MAFPSPREDAKVPDTPVVRRTLRLLGGGT